MPQERSFGDDDGIDPRLLKAAQMLADDRHRREGTQEISLDDIEGVDD